MAYKNIGDIIGIGLSLVCMIHCLLLPILLTTLPFLGVEIIENKILEIIIILFSALIGGYAIKKGFFKFHKSWLVICLFILGILLMLLGNFLPFPGEVASKLGGAILIICSHIQNWRLSKNVLLKINPTLVAFAE